MKESDWSPLSGLSGSRDCGAAFDPVQRVLISDASRSHHALTGCELVPKSFRQNLKNVKDPTIDSELVYSYAKTNAGTAMEEFVSGTNTANVQAVGDKRTNGVFVCCFVICI